MKKTEAAPIQLNNHEKLLICRLAKIIRKGETARAKQIEQEDKEDEKYRRKIVK